MDWEDTKQHFCILPYQEIIIKNNLKLFLRIKAKYKLVYLHWTPLLEPLSVLLPPSQITNEFTYLYFKNNLK